LKHHNIGFYALSHDAYNSNSNITWYILDAPGIHKHSAPRSIQ
jgi:hypothetical protein